MVLGLFILKFLGFYLLYTNSHKTNYVLVNWERSIRKQKHVTLSLGGFLIGATCVGFMLIFGLAGGFFYSLTLLMFIAGLTVLLRPLMTKEQPKHTSHAGK
ncbi:hypothetical protein [Fluviicola sp.]|uniref:hypothetical protein n=1 Tax=Fluviicola sp. TaxID=1917219 RepID=UPI0031D1F02E